MIDIKKMGLSLIIAGLVIIIISVAIAYQSFYGYKVPEIRGSNLDETIASLVSALVDIAVKLGFLGVTVWAGSILLKYGIQAYKPESPRPKE